MPAWMQAEETHNEFAFAILPNMARANGALFPIHSL